MRNEPATKISFGEAKDGQVLIGVGVRKQHFVKVYGVGLYVDLPAAKESMSPFKGKKAKAQGIDFYEASQSQLQDSALSLPALTPFPLATLVVTCPYRSHSIAIAAAQQRQTKRDAAVVPDVAPAATIYSQTRSQSMKAE